MQVATYNPWNTVTNQIQGKSERGREGSLDDDNGILLIFRYCNVKLRAMTIFFQILQKAGNADKMFNVYNF